MCNPACVSASWTFRTIFTCAPSFPEGRSGHPRRMVSMERSWQRTSTRSHNCLSDVWAIVSSGRGIPVATSANAAPVRRVPMSRARTCCILLLRTRSQELTHRTLLMCGILRMDEMLLRCGVDRLEDERKDLLHLALLPLVRESLNFGDHGLHVRRERAAADASLLVLSGTLDGGLRNRHRAAKG